MDVRKLEPEAPLERGTGGWLERLSCVGLTLPPDGKLRAWVSASSHGFTDRLLSVLKVCLVSILPPRLPPSVSALDHSRHDDTSVHDG